jgi:stage II sporulation protein AB (anti-sigma F factor)
MKNDNLTITLKAMPENESLTRSLIAGYATRVNPTMEILSDIKTAVSEAVTNAVIHAYNGDTEKDICVKAKIADKVLTVQVIDYGVGIENLNLAMKDFFTTKINEERSGLGFTIMGSFMDSLDVTSVLGEGTTVTMTKKLA